MFGASGPGVELRVGYFNDSPLGSQMMPDIESARVLAQSWLDAARALGIRSVLYFGFPEFQSCRSQGRLRRLGQEPSRTCRTSEQIWTRKSDP